MSASKLSEILCRDEQFLVSASLVYCGEMAVPLRSASKGADTYRPRVGGNGAGALHLLLVKGQGKLQGAEQRIIQSSLKPRVYPLLSC